MKISDYGISFIISVEGCRLTSYKDCKGIWTIGVGHTGAVDGMRIHAGMHISQDKVNSLLREDITKCEKAINRLVTYQGLTQNMYDALCSFCFNLGANILVGSTLLRRVNAGDIKGAAAKFDAYHKPVQIIGRRNKEKALFLAGSEASDTNKSTVSKSATFNQHLHDLQWAANRDKITTLVEDGLWGKNSNMGCRKIFLRVGSEDFHTIAWVQCRTGAKVDGKFGHNTKRQVIIWQTNHNLKPDGIAGYNTITSILREYGVNT